MEIRRSSRVRKEPAPKHPPLIDRQAEQRKFSASSKKQKVDTFESKYLLTNPKSCLVTANLSSILNIHTWELLSDAEKEECLALLPAIDKEQKADGTWSIEAGFFQHNTFLQDSLREFQENLGAGKLMPGYVKRTIQASIDRAAGKADDYKDAQFEQFWGEKAQECLAKGVSKDTERERDS